MRITYHRQISIDECRICQIIVFIRNGEKRLVFPAVVVGQDHRAAKRKSRIQLLQRGPPDPAAVVVPGIGVKTLVTEKHKCPPAKMLAARSCTYIHTAAGCPAV